MSIKIVNDDVLKVLKNMESDCIDLIVTDPPYKLEMPKNCGVDKLLKNKGINRVDEDWDKFSLNEYIDWCEKWIMESFRVLKDTGSMFIFGSYHNIGLINYILQKNKLMIINDICWYKRNAVPNLACRRFTASYENILWVAKNKKYTYNYLDMKNGEFKNDNLKVTGKQMRNVWDIPTAGNESFKITLNNEIIKHPTQKPTEVFKRCVLAGVIKNDKSVVLDLFAGSGTLGVVCNELNYNSILVEKDEKYIELMKDRFKYFDYTTLANGIETIHKKEIKPEKINNKLTNVKKNENDQFWN
jgi:site-specific DNA-methyltransferase (adenine-specific)